MNSAFRAAHNQHLSALRKKDPAAEEELQELVGPETHLLHRMRDRLALPTAYEAFAKALLAGVMGLSRLEAVLERAERRLHCGPMGCLSPSLASLVALERLKMRRFARILAA